MPCTPQSLAPQSELMSASRQLCSSIFSVWTSWRTHSDFCCCFKELLPSSVPPLQASFHNKFTKFSIGFQCFLFATQVACVTLPVRTTQGFTWPVSWLPSVVNLNVQFLVRFPIYAEMNSDFMISFISCRCDAVCHSVRPALRCCQNQAESRKPRQGNGRHGERRRRSLIPFSFISLENGTVKNAFEFIGLPGWKE